MRLPPLIAPTLTVLGSAGLGWAVLGGSLPIWLIGGWLIAAPVTLAYLALRTRKPSRSGNGSPGTGRQPDDRRKAATAGIRHGRAEPATGHAAPERASDG